MAFLLLLQDPTSLCQTIGVCSATQATTAPNLLYLATTMIVFGVIVYRAQNRK
jgi:hypothetical protein